MSLRLINNKGKHTCITPNELRLAGMNTWKDWKCSVGINAMHIDLVGNVWGATCRVGGKMASIHDLPFHILDVPLWTTCTEDMCGCTADIRLPKIKEDIYFDLLNSHGDYVEKIDDYQALNWMADIVHISWDLGKQCNYSCSYCPPYLHSKTAPHLPYKQVIEIIDYLLDGYFAGRQTEFSFAGGEPTIHPQFIEVVRHINDKGSRCLITTNGSRSLKYFKELAEHLNLMIVSHHFEYIRLDEMANKISQLINESNCRYIIRLMMKPGIVNDIHEFTQNYKEFIGHKRVAFEFTPIRQQKPFRALIVEEYTDDETAIISELQQTFLGKEKK